MSDLVLAMDTSGALVTAAVARVASNADLTVLSVRSTPAANQHAELLTPMINEALTEARVGVESITAVAVGAGPGPFTGLRVGLATARVFALSRGIPVHGVVSLDALAVAVRAWQVQQGATLHDVVIATDARRREIYWAEYSLASDVHRLGEPKVGAPAEVPLAGRDVFGRGAALYADLLGAPADGAPIDVTGEDIARAYALGLVTAPEPQYLRRPDAQVPGARKRVL